MDKKLFYKIGEVSRMTGLESYVLRYWETEFPMLKPKKNSGGQRVYIRKDVDLIIKIKRMLYNEGYTIVGAKRRLRVAGPKRGRREIPRLLTKVRSELQQMLDEIRNV